MTNHPNRSKQQQAKHTPGPWHITTQRWDRDTGTALNGETLTLRMNGPCDAVIASLGAPKVEQKANARLIAAAPELLAALKDTANVLVEIQQYLPSHVVGNVEDWRQLVRAAIAKAEGR